MRSSLSLCGTFIALFCLLLTCFVVYIEDDYRIFEDFSMFPPPAASKEAISHPTGEAAFFHEHSNSTFATEKDLIELERAEKRFQFRSEHLKRECAKNKDTAWQNRSITGRYRREWIQNDNFVIVPESSFLICVVPKCGSSSWHWLARDMRDPLRAGHSFGWQDRQKNTDVSHEVPPSVGLQLLNDKHTFVAITVRHPFARLISGWNDKLAKDVTYSSFMLEAYPHMREYARKKDESHVLAFEDLAEYIAAYGEDTANLDYHFMPVQNLCQPCLYPYKYVVKLETINQDEDWLKTKLNISKFPWEQKGKKYFFSNQNNPGDIIRSFFHKVKTKTIRKLMKIYHNDFAVFDYSFDVDTLTAGGFS